MSKDFTTTLLVEKPPKDVFNAITNVRGWWAGFYSEKIEGRTERLNDEFTFRAGEGAHYSKQKLVEVVPNKKVVWLITDSELNFLKKKNEWNGTKIIFDISGKGNKTQLRFTHQGLVPEIECYDSCAPAWTMYVQQKLLPLIANGIDQKAKDFTVTISATKSPKEVFKAINNVRAWWSEDIDGNTDKMNAEWLYHYKDIHSCKIKITELTPDKRIVWKVLENEFNFTKTKSEWKGNSIIFDISREDGKTKVKFTHEGLVPEYECYEVCNDAWTGYITNSLKNWIEKGKGNPNQKDKDGFNAELAKKWRLE